jgi:DNA-binding MarR family transcriptional regulator
MPTATRVERNHDDPQLGKVLGFMRLLWSIDHGLQSLSKRMDTRIGVTGPQRLALRILGRFPGIPAGRLAEILKVHPSTLTGIIRRLEARGLVERRADATDRRRALLTLTAAGKRIDAQRQGTVEGAVRQALARLPAQKIAVAEEVLAAIGAELET